MPESETVEAGKAEHDAAVEVTAGEATDEYKEISYAGKRRNRAYGHGPSIRRP